jgi:hypothetical protein
MADLSWYSHEVSASMRTSQSGLESLIHPVTENEMMKMVEDMIETFCR